MNTDHEMAPSCARSGTNMKQKSWLSENLKMN